MKKSSLANQHTPTISASRSQKKRENGGTLYHNRYYSVVSYHMMIQDLTMPEKCPIASVQHHFEQTTCFVKNKLMIFLTQIRYIPANNWLCEFSYDSASTQLRNRTQILQSNLARKNLKAIKKTLLIVCSFAIDKKIGTRSYFRTRQQYNNLERTVN